MPQYLVDSVYNRTTEEYYHWTSRYGGYTVQSNDSIRSLFNMMIFSFRLYDSELYTLGEYDWLWWYGDVRLLDQLFHCLLSCSYVYFFVQQELVCITLSFQEKYGVVYEIWTFSLNTEPEVYHHHDWSNLHRACALLRPSQLSHVHSPRKKPQIEASANGINALFFFHEHEIRLFAFHFVFWKLGK